MTAPAPGGAAPPPEPARRGGRWHWLVTLPVAALLVLFALSNRAPVRLTLWPFNLAVEAPVSLVVLAVAAIAFLAGALLASLTAWRHLRRARRLERETARLAQEIVALRHRLTEIAPAAAPPDRPHPTPLPPPGR